jgi:hypothetical protein
MSDPIKVYQFTVIRAALKLYLNTGVKANTSYTPSNMVAKISEVTGKHYTTKRASMEQALSDLNDWLARNGGTPNE